MQTMRWDRRGGSSSSSSSVSSSPDNVMKQLPGLTDSPHIDSLPLDSNVTLDQSSFSSTSGDLNRTPVESPSSTLNLNIKPFIPNELLKGLGYDSNVTIRRMPISTHYGISGYDVWQEYHGTTTIQDPSGVNPDIIASSKRFKFK